MPTSRTSIPSLALGALLALSVLPLPAGAEGGVDRRRAEVREVWVDVPGAQRAVYRPGWNDPEVWSGEVAEPGGVTLVVVGPGLLAASALEIQGAGGSILAGSALTITERVPGSPLGPERIRAALTLNPALTPGADYTVRIRFPLEGGPPVTFRLQVYESGEVERIEHTAGELTYGHRAEFTLIGRQVGRATPDLDRVRGLEGVEVVRRSETATTIAGTIAEVGGLCLDVRWFYDLGNPSPPDVGTRRYRRRGQAFGDPGSWAGAATGSSGDPACHFAHFEVALAPELAEVQPRVVRRGEPVAVTGIGVVAHRWLDPVAGPRPVRIRVHYPGEQGPAREDATNSSGPNTLVFVVPDDAVSGVFQLSYELEGRGEVGPFPWPTPVEVALPPAVTRMRSGGRAATLDAEGGTSGRLLALPGGSIVLEGRHLRNPDGSNPLVRLGQQQLTILEARPTSVRVAPPAADPALSDATLTVETDGGRWATTALRLVDAPELVGPVRMSEATLSGPPPADDRYWDVGDGALYRDRRFIIPGRNLEPIDVSGGRTPPTLEVAGVTLGMDRFTVSPSGDAIHFELHPEGGGLPADPLGSGRIVYRTSAGETALGPHTIRRAPPALESIWLEADSVLGGQTLRGQVRMAKGVGPEGDWLYLSAQPTGVVSVGPREEIIGGTVHLALEPAQVETPTNVTLRAEKNGVVREATFRVLPLPDPRPTSVAFDHPRLVGDNPVTVFVELDRPADGETLELVASDPSLVQLPSTLQAAGQRVEIAGRTAAVTEQQRVHVTARIGDHEASGEILLTPRRPMLDGIHLPAERVMGPARFEAEVRVAYHSASHPPVTVELAGSPGVSLPRSVTVTDGRVSVPVDVGSVSSLTRARIDARSEFGEVSVAFAITPLAIRDVVVEPTALQVRERGRVTLVLAGPAGAPVRFQLRPRSPGIVDLPGEVVVETGRPELVLPMLGLAPGEVTVDVVPDDAKSPLASFTVRVRRE